MASASREFQVFVKPAGPLCNLDCRYCYYLEKQQLYPERESFRMPDDLLESYIVQHIQASPGDPINFSWHGGEPTILGLDFFRRVVALQRKHIPADRRISNGIQTNGILLDEDWCRFLAAEGFRVGLSLDGPADLHDAYRVTKGQKPTHAEVVRGFRRLQRYGIPCDILCVVNDLNARHPTRVYRYFKTIGARSLGFLPLVARDRDRAADPASIARGANGTGTVSPQSVPAEQLGVFLCTIFDEWVRHDIGRVGVQIFEEAARPAYGLDHSLCIFRETCGDIPVIEHNGDCFACDHYVDSQHRLGTIRESRLVDLIESPAQRAFGAAKRDTLPQYCRACPVRVMCNGGCPKDRFIRTPDGEPGLNYLCAGFKRFFSHCLPYMLELGALDRARQPPERLMQLVRSGDQDGLPAAGRNDPCPCGSGRKYKKCCLGT